jgi:hypothetical protein
MEKAIELVGHVDEHHHLSAQAPLGVRPGPVKLALLLPDDSAHDNDPADSHWMRAVARQWSEELADTRQDIYTLSDGEPVDKGG